MRASHIVFFTASALALLAAPETSGQTSDADDGHRQLARLIGTWEGQSSDGRFREHTRYRWGPGEQHLVLEMRFFVDDQQTGTGSGFMVWDAERNALVFLFVSSHGTAITQVQTGGDRDHMELSAEAFNGGVAGFPPKFRTHIEFTAEDRYESGVWMPDEHGGWTQVMSNSFRRVASQE